MATHIQVVPWATLLLTVLVVVVLSPRGHRTHSKPIVAGVLGGLLLLFDPILVLALPILTLYSALRTPRFALLMTLACLSTIAPWLYRNWLAHGELVFIKSTFGYACWQGNNPQSWGTDKVPKAAPETLQHSADRSLRAVDRALWEARHETYYIDDLLLKPGGYAEFAGLTEPQRSRLLGRRAWQFIRNNPGRYARLCAARLRYFLLFDETNPKAANLVYRLSTLAWLVLAVGGLIEVAIDRSARAALWPLLAIFAAVSLFHVLTIVSARFRMPLEPLTFVWCALAAARLIEVPAARWPAKTSSLPALDHAQVLAHR
jgi:hypothetical protein